MDNSSGNGSLGELEQSRPSIGSAFETIEIYVRLDSSGHGVAMRYCRSVVRIAQGGG